MINNWCISFIWINFQTIKLSIYQQISIIINVFFIFHFRNLCIILFRHFILLFYIFKIFRFISLSNILILLSNCIVNYLLRQIWAIRFMAMCLLQINIIIPALKLLFRINYILFCCRDIKWIVVCTSGWSICAITISCNLYWWIFWWF